MFLFPQTGILYHYFIFYIHVSTPSTNLPLHFHYFSNPQGRYQIDRDGCLFRHILNFLRNRGTLSLPEHFPECELLRLEAEYYGLEGMVKAIRALQTTTSDMAGTRLITAKTSSLTLVPPSSPGAIGQEPSSPNSQSPSNFGGYGVPKGTGGPGYITVGYRGLCHNIIKLQTFISIVLFCKSCFDFLQKSRLT